MARSTTRTFRRPVLYTGFAVAFLGAAPALASPAYPPAIQAQLALPQAPDCTLCHRDNIGGVGTVVRPFGRTMIDRFGLTGGSNLTALKAAIEGDDTEHVDSDGDGVPDIDELRAGTNPNVGTSGAETSAVPLPETGCAFFPRERARSGVASFLALLLAGLALARRRRTEYLPSSNPQLGLEERK